ncbi:hypothetical protein Rumeso_04966 [Rubellimicrobium mesophilum DSM 19309]|uniref:DUF1697 domain-containing protein n=1 Tax=Rubellimicrobium mesophilum DSM 19309 TaxID=442562 RepID=A0A017HB98_9RHOB|nr:DUF1697 domain-containing protein [Rubellimicrobium mesophilum]EYD71565.1 hypothetical protein Rumeso_04966 [Rubellimicrobium mesophilum DSM 19309]
MTAYVLLFRGVGGATQLPTGPLRAALSEAGFARVATYINSGNAILTSDRPIEEVSARVAAICEARFGFRKDIHVRTREDWVDLVARNPFPEATAAPTTLHAAVLAGDPAPERVARLQALDQGWDRIAVVGRVAYLHTPSGFGASLLATRFDKGIGVPNTARNWNTVRRLLELLDVAAGLRA